MKITKETSYPNEWAGTFTEQDTWATLQFHDGRRLYGWVKEWPPEPNKGHIALTGPSWVHDATEQKITGVEDILINMNDVRWVEFMQKPQDNKNV